MNKETLPTREMGYFNASRFIALCERTTMSVNNATNEINLAGIDTIMKIYHQLNRSYQDQKRTYHNKVHINDVLRYLYSASHLAVPIPDLEEDIAGFNAVELAAWTHDVVYDARKGTKDNEERSALEALHIVRSLALPDRFGQEVAHIVLATKHTKTPDNINARLLCDADIAAAFVHGEKEYEDVVRKVRKEYAWASDEEFVIGRRSFYEPYIEGKPIFLTEFFRDRYEEQALQNIRHSYKELPGIIPA